MLKKYTHTHTYIHTKAKLPGNFVLTMALSTVCNPTKKETNKMRIPSHLFLVEQKQKSVF